MNQYYNNDLPGQLLVKTPYGKGLVLRRRRQQKCDNKGEASTTAAESTKPKEIKEVRLLEWENAAKTANNSFHQTYYSSKKLTMLYTTNDYESVEMTQGMDVVTPFGRGRVLNTVTVRIHSKIDLEDKKVSNDDGAMNKVEQLLNVESSTTNDHQMDDHPTTSASTSSTDCSDISTKQKEQCEESLPPQKIQRKERVLTKYQIELTSWRLAGRSTVKCYLFQSSQSHNQPNQPKSPEKGGAQIIKAVRHKTLYEMNTWERVELAVRQKQSASLVFSKREYQEALNIYAGAVDAVRNVQHNANSSNECRADLIDVMVTCSNNAATCCVQLGRFQEAAKFAKNALVLLDALWSKKGSKIHKVLVTKVPKNCNGSNAGLCDAKIFGEWRIKSYLILSKAALEMDDYAESLISLRKARDLAISYTSEEVKEKAKLEDDSTTMASISRLQKQQREIKKLMVKAMERKKEVLKKEKARAQAMFGGGVNSNLVNGSEVSSPIVTKDVSKSSPKNIDINITSKSNGFTNVNSKSQTVENVENCSIGDDKEIMGNDEIAGGQSSLRSTTKRDDVVRRKSVSFSPNLEERLIIESRGDEGGEGVVGGDKGEESWYDEHKEALILLAVGGAVALSTIFMRGGKR